MELPERVRVLLQTTSLGHVVTLNRDGSPQVTLVWVDVEDGRLVFNTAEGRQKPRNLRRDPRVAVSVQDTQNPRLFAVISGTATITAEGAQEHIERLSQKYTGRPYTGQPGQQRIKVIVDATRVSGMGPNQGSWH